MASSDDSVTAVELDDPLVGTIFDKRFRIDERLAAGGFGAIYRATHVKSGHQIALKVLHPNLASDLGVLARFRREGTTLTSLRSPHTITAYEFGQVDKILFIVLELLHGETLFDRYSLGGPMEWKKVVHIAKQVCESLEEAHAQGIVHRDLKPTNIHLEHINDDPDFVKVLDFGIAKIVRGSAEHEASDITNAGQMIGTLDYMSPEQMVGGQVTGQTDIYTLGIVMYEMVAGTRPFPESASATAALAAMLRMTPEPLYLRSPIPRELDAVVMRCLEKETTKRYRSVAELRADLNRISTDTISATTATVMVPRRNFEDQDETAITPPPEILIDASRKPGPGDLKTPKVEIKLNPEPKTPRMERKQPDDLKTPRVERDDIDHTPRFERAKSSAKSTVLAEWDEEDERAPTTTRRPDGMDEGVVSTPSPRAKSAPVSIPPTPPTRPLEVRHQATPVPQLVVAPFSQTPRTPAPSDPRMRSPTGQVPVDARSRTPTGQPPFGGIYPSPVPGQVAPQPPGFASTNIGLPPPPQYPPVIAPSTTPMHGLPSSPYGNVAPPHGGYDMSKLAARDATMRRVVWIVVIVIAVIAGVVIAAKL